MATNRFARIARIPAAGGVLALVLACGTHSGDQLPEHMTTEELQFKPDASWPRELPGNWILGQVSGLSVDDRDHVWIVHRPRTLTPEEAGAAQDPPISMCCVPAPPVIEFDPAGNVVQAWGGPGDGFDWPQNEHGIHADSEGHVWIGGNGANDSFILKFTRDGRFLMQIGETGQWVIVTTRQA